jgi:integrase
VLELGALKRMYNLALRAEKITKKPYIPPLEVNNACQGFFERAEFEAILARLPEYRRPPITFAYRIGWRFHSEVLTLTWAQVDLETGTVRLEVNSTKNKGGRLIYLPQDLLDLLEGQWREHLAYYPACPFIFHRYGHQIQRIDTSWRRARREANLTGKIPHDFRRTAVRNMVRAGIPERVAMMISGHKTRTIFDRYHIVSEGDLKEAARKLEGTIRDTTVTTLATIPPQTQPTL